MSGKKRIPSLLTWLLLLLIFFFFVSLKLHHLYHHEKYSYPNGQVWFSAESALHYKYTCLIAQGKPLPAVDFSLQPPEGLSRKTLSLGMEYFYGYAYRFFSLFFSLPFPFFLIHALALFSSLFVFPVYLLSRHLWQSRLAGLFSAAFYVTTVASFGRFTSFAFTREDFSLLFIFLNLLFLVKFLDTSSKKHAFYSALSLSLALATWHLTQFYLLLLTGFAFLAFLFLKQPRLKNKITHYFLLLTPFLFLTGLLTPYLRQKLFLLSLPMAVPYAFVILALLRKFGLKKESLRSQKKEKMFFLSAVLLLSFLFLFLASGYSYVFSLLFYKLLCFGKKPLDPAKLLYLLRIYWTAGFETASFTFIKKVFYLLLPFSLVVLCLYLKDKSKKGFRGIRLPQWLLLYFTFTLAFLFFFIRRLHVFLVFFLVLWLGYLFSRKEKPAPQKKISRKLILSSLFSLLLLVPQGIHSWNYCQQDLTSQANKELVDYLKYHTPDDSLIAANLPVSQLVNTYAERPVLFHTVFESPGLREKYRSFEFSLLRSEPEFYRYLRELNASYFVYSLGLDQTVYYDTAASEENKASAALSQFRNKKNLTYFLPVFSNSYHLVYSLVNSSEDHYRQAIKYLQNDQTEKALKHLKTAVRLNPRHPDAYNRLGITYSGLGKQKLALHYWKEGLKADPTNQQIINNLRMLKKSLTKNNTLKKLNPSSSEQ